MNGPISDGIVQLRGGHAGEVPASSWSTLPPHGRSTSRPDAELAPRGEKRFILSAVRELSDERPGSLLGKARAIVEACARAGELGLNELARRSGVPKATVHRVSAELIDWGVLERVSGRYRLGPRLYELGQQVPRNRLLRAAALPFMEDLYLTTRESVHLGVRGDLEYFRVERFLGPRGVSAARTPNRSALHSSASGKVLLAFAEPEVLDRLIQSGLRPRTKFTITDPNILRVAVAEARKLGYAVDRQEHILGYCAVSAPVFAGTDPLVGCLSLVAPSDRFDPNRLVPALLTATRGLSRALGGP